MTREDRLRAAYKEIKEAAQHARYMRSDARERLWAGVGHLYDAIHAREDVAARLAELREQWNAGDTKCTAEVFEIAERLAGVRRS